MEDKRPKEKKLEKLSKILSDYCANTTGHGFQYWVSARSRFERVLWVAVVVAGFSLSLIAVSSALTHWSNNPRKVRINTFTKPARDIPYPAITICNPNGFDVGEYIRAVFDNFEYSCVRNNDECQKSELLRAHFPGLSSMSDGTAVSPFYIDCKGIFTSQGSLAGGLYVANVKMVSIRLKTDFLGKGE